MTGHETEIFEKRGSNTKPLENYFSDLDPTMLLRG